ncbi:hypothetical protein DFH08DRAFT_822102 [Mycena albidolilacea]|uniref:Uncharacterized protein n=1 Tax=Mycena albidolilacea TaxID=1033008 RepID=A0AAD7EDE2_9AGAR|nr:hypothetical protein DFH08DRAFT_822102 [Mycena albidolilacea]
MHTWNREHSMVQGDLLHFGQVLAGWCFELCPKTAKSGQLARRGKNLKRAAFLLAGSLLASALNSSCKTIFGGYQRSLQGSLTSQCAKYSSITAQSLTFANCSQVTLPGNIYDKMGGRYGIEACANDKVGMMVSDNGQCDDGEDSRASK